MLDTPRAKTLMMAIVACKVALVEDLNAFVAAAVVQAGVLAHVLLGWCSMVDGDVCDSCCVFEVMCQWGA